jgi:tryptophanyl-tRNA synthetase
MSRINLTDDADAIALKLQKAKSDALPGLSVDPEGRPEATNLLTIYAALSDRAVADVAAEFAASSFSNFKSLLTELAVTTLVPIAGEMRRLLADPAHLDGILADGGARARAIAAPVLDEVRDAVGFLRPTKG